MFNCHWSGGEVNKAVGSTKIRQAYANEGALTVIPSKRGARNPVSLDTNLYAMRNIVERFFCKMKDMRRLAMRFENQEELPEPDLYLRHQMLLQLSPHPSILGGWPQSSVFCKGLQCPCSATPI